MAYQPVHVNRHGGLCGPRATTQRLPHFSTPTLAGLLVMLSGLEELENPFPLEQALEAPEGFV
ncbi:MAG: hypothetical protein A3B73_02670 [Omnitrophica WOR_2 bacterium RIFCSPHIGHO2_02_FULL_63_39]|nr:MAG: hypothetical protein A3E56_04030 [Omnitrophica WOR_2 bacterium RIFCSPHIGHO2_12_FULL_64_13]OGX36652.1 MAG: hypothetical protein A3B73_02670 [Omnitrophica WOR_2 bacterium RIFCSPHIGHO2_02_FULL_63_39]